MSVTILSHCIVTNPNIQPGLWKSKEPIHLGLIFYFPVCIRFPLKVIRVNGNTHIHTFKVERLKDWASVRGNGATNNY